MAVFKMTYYDLDKDIEFTREYTYDGPELSERETWEQGLYIALKWCHENKCVLNGITNISM
jgi:hypothetical protein